MRWNDRFHGVELLCWIATRVDFRGRQSRVSQPQRHLTDVLRCLQDDHRACVPEHVGRDAFLVEAGMCSSGGRCMLLEQIGEAPSAQRLSPSVDEHLGRCDPTANGEPCAQGRGGGLPQGERAFPSPLILSMPVAPPSRFKSVAGPSDISGSTCARVSSRFSFGLSLSVVCL